MKKLFKVTERIVLSLCLLLAACDLVPRKVAMDDPRIQPLLKAAAAFDRMAYGFTPIPKSADVRWESRPTAHYDAMLHISAKTSRTIAFRKTDSDWRWIGDQETFEGPKMVKTVDGTFPENLTLTYEVEQISGSPINQLTVRYIGEDPRLVNKGKLGLVDVRPILKEWGY